MPNKCSNNSLKATKTLPHQFLPEFVCCQSEEETNTEPGPTNALVDW